MNRHQLEAQFDEAKTRAQSMLRRLTASAEAEGRTLSPTEKASIEEATREAKGIRARLQSADNDASMVAEIERLTGGMGTRPSHRHGGSLGAQFVNSDAMKWWQNNRDRLPQAWQSPSVELYAATLTEDAASGGDLVVPDFRPGIVAFPQRPLTVADLIAPGTTTSNLITYMKETTFTNAADTVAEGTTKPESTLVFDAVSDPVRKIAHWVPCTEEILSDVGQMRSYVDTRMRLGVDLAEDDQLVNGSVVAPDIIGFLNRTGLAADVARGADTNADAVLKQIAAIFAANLVQPSALIMHPTNWLAIQLLKTAAGEYISGAGPFSAPQRPVLWGLPVAVSPVIAVGTALVGCFDTCAQLFRNGGIRVDVSNSHSDFYVKNLVAVRAERREALCVFRPAAFGKVTGLL